jgi:hypothetical protein
MSVIGFLRWRAACGVALGAMSLATLGYSLAPASAGAVSFQPFYEYAVTFTGKGSYHRTLSSEGGGMLKEEASWTWTTRYPEVLIPTKASSPLEASGFPAYGLGQDGDGNWSITNTGSEDEDCSNSGTLGLPKSADGAGGGSVTVKRPAGGAKGVIFNIVALESYETTSGAGDGVLACDPESYWHDIIESFAGVGFKHTDPDLPDVRPLTAKITLSPSDLKHATVTKHVSIGPAEEISSDCGSGGGNTCQQEYTWSGSVKFVKHKFK